MLVEGVRREVLGGGNITASSGSQVNISGGVITGGDFDPFTTLSGSEVNISGGNIEHLTASGEVNISGGYTDDFTARSGSQVNMSGGIIRAFSANSGSQVILNGGSINGFFSRGDVEFVGGEFRLNNADFTGSTISLVAGDIFTGTLNDGSSFILNNENISLLQGNASLTTVPLAAPNLAPVVVNALVTGGPVGLRAGQTLTVEAGGELPDFFPVVSATLNVEDGIVGDTRVVNGEANVSGGRVSSIAAIDNSIVNISGGNLRGLTANSGSKVNISGGDVGSFARVESAEVDISGGDVGENFQANSGGVVNISGGNVGRDFGANTGSEVNISGGSVGDDFRAIHSEVNISGGSVGDDFIADFGSVVNISGGNVGRDFRVNSGSEVTISGGTFDRRFISVIGSDTELVGGEFRLNGAEITDSTVSITSRDILSGTLKDGSSFIFRRLNVTQEFNLSTVPLAAADPNRTVTTPVTSGPSGLRAGQTLTVQDGGALGTDWAVVDATLIVEAGTVGDRLEATRSVVDISGGSVGESFHALFGTEVNISGGTLGDNFEAFDGSEVNISGGSIGEAFRANFDSVVNISGGNIGEGFRASSGSEVNLFGTEFFLNGVSLDMLTLDESFAITERGGSLSGKLADGSLLNLKLGPNDFFGGGFFSENSTLTVTLVAVPEPNSLVFVTLMAMTGLTHRRRRARRGMPIHVSS